VAVTKPFTKHVSTNIFYSIRVFSHLIHRAFYAQPGELSQYSDSDWTTQVSITGRVKRCFSSPKYVQRALMPPPPAPVTYSLGTRGFFPGIKAFGS